MGPGPKGRAGWLKHVLHPLLTYYAVKPYDHRPKTLRIYPGRSGLTEARAELSVELAQAADPAGLRARALSV